MRILALLPLAFASCTSTLPPGTDLVQSIQSVQERADVQLMNYQLLAIQAPLDPVQRDLLLQEIQTARMEITRDVIQVVSRLQSLSQIDFATLFQQLQSTLVLLRGGVSPGTGLPVQRKFRMDPVVRRQADSGDQ